jgi:hypothetical protein
MTVNVSLLPDGSVTVTDAGMTHPPLSPEAVQAVAGLADASAAAHTTQATTEVLGRLATLITAAGPAAGADAYAQVTVTPGHAVAVLDDVSFGLVQANLPGQVDADGNWVSGPLVAQRKPPTPTPTPTGGTA